MSFFVNRAKNGFIVRVDDELFVLNDGKEKLLKELFDIYLNKEAKK